MNEDCQYVVLVIDEEDEIADRLLPTLRRDGYEVIRAHTASQGLKLALALKPEVVLCDLNLNAKVNGIGIARTVHQAMSPPRPLLVAYSRELNGKGDAAARDAGFNAYLKDPTRARALEHEVALFFDDETAEAV